MKLKVILLALERLNRLRENHPAQMAEVTIGNRKVNLIEINMLLEVVEERYSDIGRIIKM